MGLMQIVPALLKSGARMPIHVVRFGADDACNPLLEYQVIMVGCAPHVCHYGLGSGQVLASTCQPATSVIGLGTNIC